MCAWKTLYRSELKEMIHTLDCIKYETRDQLHVKPNNFLNGHDTDCAEDRWTDNIVDPSTYIGKTKDEIYQSPNLNSSSSSSGGGFVSGYLTPSQWIRFNIESYSASSSSSSESSPYDPHKAAYVGDLNFEVVDTILKTGNLYICVYSSDSGSDWNVSRNVEYCWDISSESQIRPDSKKTYFGYYFRNNYLYMHVATNQHFGWVRMLIADLVEPSDKENYITNEWCFSEPGYAYRNVSILQAVTNEDELYVCGNMVPYNETFQGIRQYYNTNICSCHVEDDVEISLYEYQEDAGGDYIKVESSVPVGNDSRKEHRYIPKIYESILPNDFTGAEITELDYYLLNQYMPLYLYESIIPLTILTWQRSDDKYYSKTLVDSSEWYPSNLIGAQDLCPE